MIKSYVNNTEHMCSNAISEDRLVLVLQPGDKRAKSGTIKLENLKNDKFLLREKGSVGIGVAILPKDLVEHSVSSGYVCSCEIEEIDLTRHNYIVWHEGKYLTDKMKELMETVCHENM